ncbi:glycosyltransferase family 4 protein [Roseibium sp. HPY-6]|uniref:glycosyltransferase family 4 protein n=1 Tax=Roseibium sp. HPY-6 TaxID=3229852 RepID=UPI00338DB425
MTGRLRVLIVASQCDRSEIGESHCGYEWISRIAKVCDVTLLTLHLPGRVAPSLQLPGVRVIEWNALGWVDGWRRLNGTLKPFYVPFYFRARSWIKNARKKGEHFDLIHHLTPMAFRFPTPCAGLGYPYIIGPVAGGLPTPEEFKAELKTEPLFARLRETDNFRLRYDPFLRRTYKCAEAVICSGEYVSEALSHLNLKRVEYDTEVGIDSLAISEKRPSVGRGKLRLLFVGRVIRTKGVRDAVRAMAKLKDLPEVVLKIAGDGEDLQDCRKEAEALGVTDQVQFLGRVPKDEVDELYADADVFLFPSFREPTGIVLFEAMRHGLPVITTSIGGPGHIVDNSCGIRLSPSEPAIFADELASSIRTLATDAERLSALAKGALERVQEIGLWDRKIERLVKLYNGVSVVKNETQMR